LLISWCADGRCDMACSDEDCGRSRRPGTEDRKCAVAGRSRGRVATCAVCTWHVKTRSAGFLVEPQNQSGGEFPGLGLKTGSSDLVIWASKSPRRFLELGFKTKWASVCRLRHKTDRGRSAQDTRRDLAACLASKQVWLEFPSLA
jgi:hypothetical protein